MTIEEEEFDGFRIIKCPSCGQHKVYFKEGEDFCICPSCGKPIKKFVKEIKRKVNGYRFQPAIKTEESFFNY